MGRWLGLGFKVGECMHHGPALTLTLTLALKQCLTCTPSAVLVKSQGMTTDLGLGVGLGVGVTGSSGSVVRACGTKGRRKALVGRSVSASNTRSLPG